MNPILENIIEKRNGHYVHALEVDSVTELESCIDALVDELEREEYDKADIRDFVETLSIYYLSEVENEEDEEEVYNYNVSDRLDYLLGYYSCDYCSKEVESVKQIYIGIISGYKTYNKACKDCYKELV